VQRAESRIGGGFTAMLPWGEAHSNPAKFGEGADLAPMLSGSE
jgi:hypothetical protein